MEALWDAAVESIALEGEDGCSPERLWEVLAEPAAEAGVPLAPAVKAALWAQVLQATDCFSFCVPGPKVTFKAGKRNGKKKKKKEEAQEEEQQRSEAAAGGEQGEEQGQRNEGAAPEEAPAAGTRHAPGPLEPGCPELATWQAAAAAGAVAVAAPALRDGAVGLYENDESLTRHALSAVQRRVLSMVGARRGLGALQNVMARELGADNRNFFYVIKNLEERGLVVKRPATNVVHLTRFAPSFSKGVRMMDGRAVYGADGAPAPPAPAGAAGGLAAQDDRQLLGAICGALARAEGRTALERELKVVLGFRTTKGHRQWRRLKPQLVRRGHIQEFLGYAGEERKAVRCIRLLKEWRDDGGGGGSSASSSSESSDSSSDSDSSSSSSSSSDSDSGSEDEGARRRRRRVNGLQVAELSIDRQLFRLFIAKGPDGLSTREVERNLKLSTKRNTTRLRELERRFGATTQTGRSISMRYTAPPSLLERYGADVAPVAPPQGWLAAVVEAIALGLDEGQPFPDIPPFGSSGQALQEAPGAGDASAGAPAPPAPAGEGAEAAPPAPPGEGAGVAAAAAAVEAAPAPGAADVADAAAGPGGAAEAAAARNAAGGDRGREERKEQEEEQEKERGYTLINSKRVQWMAERVARDGFMLGGELGRFLKASRGHGADGGLECEEAEGNPRATLPDRKTCQRVIDRAVAMNRVVCLSINFPSTYGGMKTRLTTVLARPGSQPNEEFVNRAYVHYKDFQKRTRVFRSARQLAQEAEAAGEELPQVDLPTILPPKQEQRPFGLAAAQQLGGAGGGDEAMPEGAASILTRNDVIKAMTLNGWMGAKMTRARLLHVAVLHLAGVLPSAQRQQASARQAEGQQQLVYALTTQPAEGGAVSKLDVRQVGAAELGVATRMLSAQQIFAELSVASYAQIVGSTCQDPGLLQRVQEAGTRVGELTPEEMRAVLASGGEPEQEEKARNRLAQALELLMRMGLLSAVVPTGASLNLGGLTATTYLVCEEGCFQEPVTKAQQQAAVQAAALAAARAVSEQQAAFAVSSWGGGRWGGVAPDGVHGLEAGTPLAQCFPFDRTREALVDRSWSQRRVMSAEQAVELQRQLQSTELSGLTWQRAAELASQLDVPYDAVLGFARHHRRVAARLGSLGTLLTTGGAIVPADEPASAMREVRRRQQREYYHRRRLREMQIAAGVPPLPPLRRGRARSGGSTGAGPAGRKRRRASAAADEEGEEDGEEDAAAASTEEGSEAEAEEEEEEEAVEVDRSVLMPLRPEVKVGPRLSVPCVAPHQARGFICTYGPDKYLYWNKVQGKPPGLRPPTLRRRLKTFKEHPEIGPLVERLVELASAVHRRRELRTAAAEAAARAASEAAAAAAAVEEEAPGAAAPAAAEEAAAAAAEEGAAAPAEDGAAGAPGPGKKRKGRGAAGDGTPAAKRKRKDSPALEPAPATPEELALDVAADEEIGAVVEQVVAIAPKQWKERPPRPTAEGADDAPGARRRRGAKALPSAADGRSVRLRAHALLRHWDAVAGGLRQAAARGMAAAAEEEEEEEGGEPTYSPGVTAALEMVKSLLLLLARRGTIGANARNALVDRFHQGDIQYAFALLAAQRLVNGPTAKSRPLQLTERMRSRLAPLDLPADLYSQAAAAAAMLQALLAQRGSVAVPPPQPAAPVAAEAAPAAGARESGAGQGATPAGDGQQEAQQQQREQEQQQQQQQQQQREREQEQEEEEEGLTGGLVAELLGRVAKGRAMLRLHRARVDPLSRELPPEQLQGDVAAVGLSVRVPLLAEAARPGAVATAAAAAAEGSEGSVAAEGSQRWGAGAGQAHGAPGVEAAAQVPAPAGYRYSRQRSVLFQPSLVACDPETQQAAEEASAAAWEAAEGGRGDRDAGAAGGHRAFCAALAAVRAAGEEGVAPGQVAAALQEAAAGAGGTSCADVGDCAEHAAELLQLMECHGLVRCAAAYSQLRYVSSEASQAWLAYPLLPPAGEEAAGAAVAAPPGPSAQGAAPTQPHVASPAAAPEEEQARQRQQERLRRLAAALRGLLLPAQGQPQACLDVPARPWVDHQGLLNEEMWESLTQRALSVATRHPGIPQDLLVMELDAVCPAYARELVQVLEEGGLLHARVALGGSTAAGASAAVSVLAACFGGSDGGGGQEGGGQHRVQQAQAQSSQRFYFPPLAPGSAPRVVPPQVLLPTGEEGGVQSAPLAA
eukprot:scaffold10.g2297.t1